MKTLSKVLAITLILLMVMISPLSAYFNVYESAYAFAGSTFLQDLESKLFVESMIPLLISAGLVFNAKVHQEWEFSKEFIDYLRTMGSSYKPPNEPDGPNLGEMVKKMLKGGMIVSIGHGIFKELIEIPKGLFELVKSFVSDNYDEGDNIIISDEMYSSSSNFSVEIPRSKYKDWNSITVFNNNYRFTINKGIPFMQGGIKINGRTVNDSTESGSSFTPWDSSPYIIKVRIFINGDTIRLRNYSQTGTSFLTPRYFVEGLEPDVHTPGSVIYGTPDTFSNPDYDWNNNQTGTKIIPIPIQTDSFGNIKKDEYGYSIPSVDTDEWIGVTPDEIPLLDPSGIPVTDVPTMPDIENPEDDEQTGIMIYIGNILQLIVGQLSKIVEGVQTILSNTNQMIFGTPTPIFDPTTGQQLDPETGEPVESKPESVVEGDGIIGNGIDTNIPTDFEWGDFRHFLDIFFIFIYFIVILILIILKFLDVAFNGLIVPSNTALFTEYSEILAGVNYIKNLKVGGLTITVFEAFEFIFMVFYYIFIIKQIRKLYNAAVNEDYHDYREAPKEMKIERYDSFNWKK